VQCMNGARTLSYMHKIFMILATVFNVIFLFNKDAK
jgi:hypothetical protein